MISELLILSSILLVAVDQHVGEDLLAEESWRSEANCGPNCLYAYLRLHRKGAPWDELRRLVPVGPSGTSLGQLKTAAAQFGLPSRIIHPALSTLHQVPLPAIAHYSGVRDGHFTLLVAVREQSVVTAEMTTCVLQEIPLHEFKQLWSGYLLVPQRHSAAIGVVLGAAGAVMLLAGLLLFVRCRRSAPTAVAVGAQMACDKLAVRKALGHG